MIESTHPTLSVQRQCELLSLPRSSLIDEEYLRHPFYGTRKMRGKAANGNGAASARLVSSLSFAVRCAATELPRKPSCAATS